MLWHCWFHHRNGMWRPAGKTCVTDPRSFLSEQVQEDNWGGKGWDRFTRKMLKKANKIEAESSSSIYFQKNIISQFSQCVAGDNEMPFNIVDFLKCLMTRPFCCSVAILARQVFWHHKSIIQFLVCTEAKMRVHCLTELATTAPRKWKLNIKYKTN